MAQAFIKIRRDMFLASFKATSERITLIFQIYFWSSIVSYFISKDYLISSILLVLSFIGIKLSDSIFIYITTDLNFKLKKMAIFIRFVIAYLVLLISYFIFYYSYQLYFNFSFYDLIIILLNIILSVLLMRLIYVFPSIAYIYYDFKTEEMELSELEWIEFKKRNNMSSDH